MRSQILPVAALVVWGCSSPEESPRVRVPVVVGSSGLETVTTNLDYEVTLESADVAIRDLEFTMKGEVATSLLFRVSEALIRSAWAHPGHYEGGDVTGELLGSFLLHFEADTSQELGTATLLTGNYQAVNFYFDRGQSGLLDGHTALLRGLARRAGTEIQFSVVIDSPAGRQLVGAPFEVRVEEGAELVAALRLLVEDPVEGDTLFDDVDFIALDGDADGDLKFGPDSTDEASVNAHNQIQRRFQTHDHFDVRAEP